MSLYVGVNGIRKEVSSLFVGVNGVLKPVSELYVGENGTKRLVYSGVNVDRDIQKVNPVKLLNSGKISKDDIGKTVYLSNANTPCQEWLIADVNHDIEDGSVDLVPKYILGEQINYGNGYYYQSNLKKWLNGTILAGFTDDVYNAMIEMQYKSHKNSDSAIYLTDKVKCPNLIEVGVTGGKSGESGYTYPIYGTATSVNSKAILRNASNTAVEYYTRTVYQANGSYSTMESVSTSGSHDTDTTSSGAMGIIRFRGNKELDIAKQLALTNPIELLASGKLNSTYIGRTVYISNPGCDCQEWLIAGVNHDNSGHYSIDLVSKYIMINNTYYAEYSANNTYYHNSALRNTIRVSMHTNFSKETIAHMGVFTYTSNGTIAKDMVVAPTTAEVGLTSDFNEGTIYPLFGSDRVYTNSKAIRPRYDSGAAINYWTRDTAGGNNASIVTSTGINQTATFASSSSGIATYAGAVGLIRFIKHDSNMSIDYQLDNILNPVEALVSGNITSNDIGKVVCLSNTAFNNIEWIIADVNHDGTSGTIDLICKYGALINKPFCSTTSSSNAVVYNNNTINELMDEIYYGFDRRVRNILADMTFRCNNTTISAKVKLPSLAELGATIDGSYNSTDGQKYPIFNSTSVILRNIVGANYDYWTRNTYTGYRLNDYSTVVYMSKYGEAKTDTCTTETGMVYRPIIRVKVQ